MRLSTNPALTTVLRLRTEGVGTRSYGPGPGQPTDQPSTSQEAAQSRGQSSSQPSDVGQRIPEQPPEQQAAAEADDLPGSSSLDWQSGLLGLRDRAQGRALDNIVAAVGKQFRPVNTLKVFLDCCVLVVFC